MAKQVKLRRGTAPQHETFIGALGEVTMDTTNKTLRVHDGETPGGTILAKLVDVNNIPDYAAPGISIPSSCDLWHTIPTAGLLYVDAATNDAISWITLILGNESSYTAFTQQVNTGARGFNLSFPVAAGQKYKLSPRGCNIAICKIIPFI